MTVLTALPPQLIADSKIQADESVTDSADELNRTLEKSGRIDAVDWIEGRLTVSGVVYDVDMQATRLIDLEGRRMSFSALSEGLEIRFGFASDHYGKRMISIVQITGPEEQLEALFNH
jgi:hypothetical protein